MPSDLTGVEYLLQIVELHPFEQILWDDLVLGGDTAYPMGDSLVIVLQAMQIRWGWSTDSACMDRGTSDTPILNSSSGGDGIWAGGDDG